MQERRLLLTPEESSPGRWHLLEQGPHPPHSSHPPCRTGHIGQVCTDKVCGQFTLFKVMMAVKKQSFF